MNSNQLFAPYTGHHHHHGLLSSASVAIAPAYPITPPAMEPDTDPRTENILRVATNVLCTEASALSSLATLYETDPNARQAFVTAVQAIARSQQRGGKTIVIGVGKSGKVGDKLVASMNSLGLLTMALNPIEALHGDLGIVKAEDVLLLITFSGNTPELKQLLPHLPQHLPMVVITKHRSLQDLPLTQAAGRSENAILLPAPIPRSEMSTFGISAPTTSTTVAMALGDALALAVGATVHEKPGAGPLEVFLQNHPGGAIGSDAIKSNHHNTLRSVAVPVDQIPIVFGSASSSIGSSIGSSNSSNSSNSSDNGMPSPAMSETSSESDLDVMTSTDPDPDQDQWCTTPPSRPSSSISSSAGTTHCDAMVRVSDCLRVAIRSPKGWVMTQEGHVVPPRRLLECSEIAEDLHAPRLRLIVRPHEMVQFPADTPLDAARRELESLAVKSQLRITEDTVVATTEHGRIVGVLEAGDLV